MSSWTTKGGLIVPKTKEPDSKSHPSGIPKEDRFSVRIFTCYYDSDTEKFQKLVKSKGGIFEEVVECDFLNIWNQRVSTQYCCVYQYKEDLEMEVLC